MTRTRTLMLIARFVVLAIIVTREINRIRVIGVIIMINAMNITIVILDESSPENGSRSAPERPQIDLGSAPDRHRIGTGSAPDRPRIGPDWPQVDPRAAPDRAQSGPRPT